MPKSITDEFRPNRYQPIPMFLERVLANWKASWKIWRMVMDWATWLYILLPGLFIFGGMYRDLLRDPPEGLDRSFLVLIYISLGLLQLIGKYRTFAEPGDGLFLHRHARWNKGKILSGFVYGFLMRLSVSALLVAIAAPLLLQIFKLTSGYLVILILYCSISGYAWILLKDRLSQLRQGWGRSLVLICSYIVFIIVFVLLAEYGQESTAVLGSAIIPMAAVAAWLMWLRHRMQGTFLHEIATENALYAAKVKWILKEAMDKKPTPMLRRPMLFPRSQPLLKHRDDTSRLLDSWFKSALRRVDLYYPMLYFASIGIAAVSLPPLLLAVLVWLALPMLVMLMLQRQWSKWLTEPYIALFNWRIEMLEQAANKVRVWGALPTMILWAIVIGVKIGLAYGGASWFAVAAAPIAGYFWLQFVNEIFASIKVFRQD
ncbi:ABC transporter permease [Cohnella mopanensis]|uniref:ABC transporter permease n=1 Tax=Cohnella mopanensis TaxID=2911966 RepID=UPI001EF9370E|nr:ABC transporter permease [Cohnella mopanensis]